MRNSETRFQRCPIILTSSLTLSLSHSLTLCLDRWCHIPPQVCSPGTGENEETSMSTVPLPSPPPPPPPLPPSISPLCMYISHRKTKAPYLNWRKRWMDWQRYCVYVQFYHKKFQILITIALVIVAIFSKCMSYIADCCTH